MALGGSLLVPRAGPVDAVVAPACRYGPPFCAQSWSYGCGDRVNVRLCYLCVSLPPARHRFGVPSGCFKFPKSGDSLRTVELLE